MSLPELRTPLAVALAALALVCTGCASDGGDTAGDDTTAAPASDCSASTSDCPAGYQCVLLSVGGWACVDPAAIAAGDTPADNGPDDTGVIDEPGDTGDEPDDTRDEPDETPAELTVALTTEGDVLSGLSHVDAIVTADLPLIGVEFQVDGLTVSTDIVPPYGVTIDTAEFDDGAHTISAWVADTAGTTATTSVDTSFDNTPPEFVSITPGDSATVFHEDGDLQLSADVDDPANVVSMTFRANGLLVGEFSAPPFEASVPNDQLFLGPEQLPKAVELTFRAEDHLGQVTEVTHTVEIHERLVWEFGTLGEIWGRAVALPNGNLVFGNLNAKVYSVTPDGEEAWSTAVAADIDLGPTVDPVTSTIYVGSLDGLIHAISSGGAILWTQNLGSPASGAPAVNGSRVYVVGFDGKVFELDAASGGVLWQVQLPGNIQSSPAVAEDGTVFVGCQDHSLYAIREGEVLWGMPTGDEVWSSPTVGAGGVVYTGSNDGWIYAVKVEGLLVWQAEIEGKIWGSPTVGSDLSVYVASTSKRLHKLDALDGSPIWDVKLDGMTYSSPVQADDGTIYVGTTPGLLYALDPVDGAVHFAFGVGDTIHATPLLAGDRVYMGSTNRSFFALWRYGTDLTAD